MIETLGGDVDGLAGAVFLVAGLPCGYGAGRVLSDVLTVARVGSGIVVGGVKETDGGVA